MSITPDFWATTAQVIPTLLLAYVVTQRPDNLKKVPFKPFRVIYSTMVLMSIALGVTAEFLTLNGLLGDGGRGAARVVIIAIGVLSFWVVMGVTLWAGMRFIPEEDDALDRMSIGRAATALAVLTGTLLFAVIVAMLPLIGAIWLAVRI